MKLISLNIWGGKVYEPLISFLKRHATDTDIFCFQDVLFGAQAEFSPKRQGRLNIFNEMQQILKDFRPVIFRTPGESHFHDEILPPDIGCGQVIFMRNSLPAIDSGGFRSEDDIYKHNGTIASGKYHWIKTIINGEDTLLMNIHGLWQKDSNKKDTPERIHQCELIQNFLRSHSEKKLICGDLNIAPDTKSMEILGRGLNNLIDRYCIKSTRSKLYQKSEKFADYILSSPEVQINSFEVLNDEVSDHLPLFLDFE